MAFSPAFRLALPMILGAVALGQAAPAMAAIAWDATGASVEGPEARPAAPAVARATPSHAAPRQGQAVTIASAQGATNLRATATGLWVMGVEARR